MNNITCLITHYNGNLKQYYKLLKNFKIIVYNKNNNNNIKNSVSIDNIGVDAYDKLYYIINNYDNLSNITLFLTDNIFKTNKKIYKFKYILNNLYILNNNDGFLTGHIYKIPQDEHNFQINTYENISLIKSSIRPFSKWFNTFINNKLPIEYIYISKKSCFAVSKNLILSNTKDYYINLLNEIIKHSNHGHDSEIPHYFERSWVEIFCKNNTKLMFHDTKTYGLIS